MLMLGRRPGESIVCTLEDSRQIVIYIESVHGNQVRVGIEAPKSIAIDRMEVHMRKQGEADHE
jgi:carbon storage regulator